MSRLSRTLKGRFPAQNPVFRTKKLDYVSKPKNGSMYRVRKVVFPEEFTTPTPQSLMSFGLLRHSLVELLAESPQAQGEYDDAASRQAKDIGH